MDPSQHKDHEIHAAHFLFSCSTVTLPDWRFTHDRQQSVDCVANQTDENPDAGGSECNPVRPGPSRSAKEKLTPNFFQKLHFLIMPAQPKEIVEKMLTITSALKRLLNEHALD